MEKKGENANWKKKKLKYVKRKRKKELYSRYYNKWIKWFRVTKLLPKIEKNIQTMWETNAGKLLEK